MTIFLSVLCVVSCECIVTALGMWVYVCVAARQDINEEANQKHLNSMNNLITIIIFFIFATNIFISVMGMERTGLFARMHF